MVAMALHLTDGIESSHLPHMHLTEAWKGAGMVAENDFYAPQGVAV